MARPLWNVGDRERTSPTSASRQSIRRRRHAVQHRVCYALLGMAEEALSSLETALDKGFGHKSGWSTTAIWIDSRNARFQAIRRLCKSSHLREFNWKTPARG